MSDYIMSITGGASATGTLADGNAMLCKNAHSITTKVLERYDNRINPPGNRMARSPDMDEEWAKKFLRARLLPGGDLAIQTDRKAWSMTEV